VFQLKYLNLPLGKTTIAMQNYLCVEQMS